MTFREFMKENGYELQTTFWSDFTVADLFGLSAIQDTFNRAFEEWKDSYKYLTELILVLNHKIWQHHETKPEVAELYNSLETSRPVCSREPKRRRVGLFL